MKNNIIFHKFSGKSFLPRTNVYLEGLFTSHHLPIQSVLHLRFSGPALLVVPVEDTIIKYSLERLERLNEKTKSLKLSTGFYPD